MKKMESYRAKKRIAISLGLLSFLLSSCEFAQTVANSGTCDSFGICAGSTGGGEDGNIPGPSLESPFSLSVKTFWESDTGNAFPTSHAAKLIDKVGGNYLNTGTPADLSLDSCQIQPGITPASPPDDRKVTCGVTIPRAQLYFSKLELTINVGKDHACDIVNYFPYGYRASNQAGFTSRWQNTPIDCSVTPTPNACYSGPMIDTPGFPDFTGLYFDIFDKTKAFSEKFLVPAANTKLRQDNRWTSYRRDGLPGGNLATDWNWKCIQKGDSENFNITLRIIPVRDFPFNDPGEGNNHFGWLDDDGEDRGLNGQ